MDRTTVEPVSQETGSGYSIGGEAGNPPFNPSQLSLGDFGRAEKAWAQHGQTWHQLDPGSQVAQKGVHGARSLHKPVPSPPPSQLWPGRGWRRFSLIGNGQSLEA